MDIDATFGRLQLNKSLSRAYVLKYLLDYRVQAYNWFLPVKKVVGIFLNEFSRPAQEIVPICFEI